MSVETRHERCPYCGAEYIETEADVKAARDLVFACKLALIRKVWDEHLETRSCARPTTLVHR